MSGLKIRILEDDGEGSWDRFVNECGSATFFHRAGWRRVLEKGLGHRAHYLFAERDGSIEGVLPLGHIRSRFFGNSLISNPFCVYGGVASVSDEARVALTGEAVRLAEKLGVDYLELRNREPANPDWPKKDLYVTFRKEIDSDPEKNLQAIPRKQRAMVRKGIKAGLQGVIDRDIDRFFHAYSSSVRNLGTPVFPKALFTSLKQTFGDACEVLTVELDGRVVASVMSFYFRDEVLPYYGGGTDEARAVKGNDFMYWDLMRRAAENGLHWFDYGRSKVGTGSYSFKKNWGFEPAPLAYEFHLVRAKSLPDVNPLNPKYRFFIEGWKRLPLSLTQRLGPLIARNLG